MKFIKWVFILLFCFILFIYILGSTGEDSNQPVIAGQLTTKSICNTSGYLIRTVLGDRYKTINQACSVKNTGNNQIEVTSGYVIPTGETMRYTAKGYVVADTLHLTHIKILNVDKDFVPWSEFRDF